MLVTRNDPVTSNELVIIAFQPVNGMAALLEAKTT